MNEYWTDPQNINRPKKVDIQKTDLVVWIELSKAQKRIYMAVLTCNDLREGIQKSGSWLETLHVRC